jgi:hypothetical protein
MPSSAFEWFTELVKGGGGGGVCFFLFIQMGEKTKNILAI